jgi:hypothetical protein
MGIVKAWLSDRLPISGMQLKEWSNEPVPNHLKRWWFCLGDTPAYLFVGSNHYKDSVSVLLSALSHNGL